MDINKRISRLSHNQAENAHRIVIITKNTGKKEIEKFQKDIVKKGIEEVITLKKNI